MSILTKRPQQAQMKLGKALPPFCIPIAGQCKINKYAKIDPNISCGSRAMIISLTDHGRTDRQTHIVSIVQTQGSFKIISHTQRSCKTHIVITAKT